MSKEHKHAQHPEIINRLRRANGHLAKVIAMIEDEQPCVKVAQQLHAVTSALDNAKHAFIQNHIEDCLDESILESRENKKQYLEEFQEITKYL